MEPEAFKIITKVLWIAGTGDDVVCHVVANMIEEQLNEAGYHIVRNDEG